MSEASIYTTRASEGKRLLLALVAMKGRLTFKAPISLTITAHRSPWSLDFKIQERRVVLPDPKNPERRVTGKRVSNSDVTPDAV